MSVRPLLVWADPSAPRRPAVLAASALALLAIGVLDSVTGSSLSFGVFYVLGVVTVTVVGGHWPGIVAALASAVLWGLADVVTGRSGNLGVDLWNGATRSGVHAIVVVLVTALLRALRGSRAAEARSREFLAAAAHQLRTPVAALSASVDVLLMEGTSPGQEQLLANVAGESRRLAHLVASLLRTARLDQGEPLRQEPADLAALCEAELERRRLLSELAWGLKIAPDTPRWVRLDPGATQELLGNVLDNAGRHAASKVDVRVRPDRARIVVEIIDDGPGLPSGCEERAFERFVTLDGRGGTGLGLAIARDLAGRQGGELVYAHKAFVLTLPITDGGGRGPQTDAGPRRT
jgi:signal transduction histidine kinase